jgi:hypothetical protein
VNLLHSPAATAIVASMQEAVVTVDPAKKVPVEALKELFAAERLLVTSGYQPLEATRTKPRRKITDKEERRARDKRQRAARVAARRLKRARS